MSITGSEQWMYSSGAAGFYDFPIEQSLRFNDDDSAKLTRTPASAGNRATWTWSAWVKRSTLGTKQSFFCATAGNYNLQFFTDNKIKFEGAHGEIVTTAVFRDVSAWYHIVAVHDTTEGTASNRFKIYVNGVQQTTSGTYPSGDGVINNTVEHGIGGQTSTNFFDGYMAEVNFIDGQALDPTSFGEVKSGIWIPKDTSGLTFGTNGFRLAFADGAAIGDDTSGNTNDFTVNNLVASDVVPDSPTNNFATWNTLDKYNYNAPSEGNLRALTAGNNGTQAATFAVSSGKWYFEVRNGSAGSVSLARFVGIAKEDTNIATIPYNNADNYLYYSTNGNSYNGGTQVTYGDSWQTSGDIIGVALDMDNGAIYFSKNGTWQNSATAAEIAAGTTTNAAFTSLSGTFVPIVAKTGGTSSNDPHDVNFGQDSTFAGNETAGGNSDANGYGDFAYAPPSGFLALCSANLPSGAIDTLNDETPEDYFNTVLYSGNGSTNAITGVGFQPNFTWFKSRSGTTSHHIADVIRGTYTLIPNSTVQEFDRSADGFTSLDSDGFTLNGGGGGGGFNVSGQTYAAWNWKAGGAGVSNTDGSITSTVSVSEY